MTPAQLSRAVSAAAQRLADDGGPAVARQALPERVTVEAPPRRGDGDYALSAAFPLARAAGLPPYDVACALRDELLLVRGVGRVEIAGGGFLNVTLDGRGQADLVAHLAGRNPQHPSAADRQQCDADRQQCDEPAADIAAWNRATGDDPRSLAIRTTRSSPLFLVQYAYARTVALLSNARELGLTAAASPERLYGTYGRRLLALLADHARVSGQPLAVRHARHLEAVAGAFFDFHDHCRVLPRGDEKPGAAHRARLALVQATETVLAGGLSLLGVTAPARI